MGCVTGGWKPPSAAAAAWSKSSALFSTRCKEPTPRPRTRPSTPSTQPAADTSKGDGDRPPISSTPYSGLILASPLSNAGRPLSAAESPLQFSALKTLTPEHRVDYELLGVSGALTITAETSGGGDGGPMDGTSVSPKASEAVDNGLDDFVMLDAADMVLPLHIIPADE